MNNAAHVKKNVGEFNDDVKENAGYRYTTNPPISSVLANKRISDCVAGYVSQKNTLVDIGCGDGVYTNEIKTSFPQIKITGLDPAIEAIQLAKDKYSDISFQVNNILDEVPTPLQNKFELGVLRGVLHHLSDQRQAIANSFELAPEIIIIEPNGNNPILKIIERISSYHRAHEEQSFTSRQLRMWCEEAGGKVVRQEFIGFVPFFFPTLPAKIIYRIQPFLEKIPLIRELFSAQIVLVCKR